MEGESFLRIVLQVLVYSACLYFFYNPYYIPKREYVCGDPSISRKHKPDTIPTRTIIIHQQVAALFLLCIITFFTEPKFNLKSTWKAALGWYKNYMFCWGLMILVLLLAKGQYGEHRPHFLDLCQSDAKNCEVGSVVRDYQCTNKNITPRKMIGISESFPSGHSALAAYFAAYFFWFIKQRVTRTHLTKYVVPTIQSVFIAYMLFCGFSRITDNAHHPKDVLCGFILGLVFAVINCSYISGNFVKDFNSENIPHVKTR